jgi:ubiquitin-like domain-containing CTD phosphatase 1
LATNGLTLVVKWSSQEYTIDSVTTDDTVCDFKNAIYKKTGVKPERQKLMGLKAAGLCPFLRVLCLYSFASCVCYLCL